MNGFMPQNDAIQNLLPFDETSLFWGYEGRDKGSDPIGYDLGNNLIYDIAQRNRSDFSRIFCAIFFVMSIRKVALKDFRMLPVFLESLTRAHTSYINHSQLE